MEEAHLDVPPKTENLKKSEILLEDISINARGLNPIKMK